MTDAQEDPSPRDGVAESASATPAPSPHDDGVRCGPLEAPRAPVAEASRSPEADPPGAAREPFDGYPLPDEDLELMILGDFYRTLKFGIDRMAGDVLGLIKRGKLDWSSGFVTSANDLLKPGQIQYRGAKLLKHSYLCPWDLAAIHIMRSCDTCESCLAGKKERCENGPRLKHIAGEQWTAEESQDHAWLEQRIQVLFRKWAGPPFRYIIRKPPIIVRPEDEQIGEEDDAWACRITDEGMQHAQEVFSKRPEFKHGGPWSNPGDKRLSPLWCRTEEQRRRAPQWMQKEFIEEGGKLSGAPIDPEPTNFAVLCDNCRNFHVPGTPCLPPRVFAPPVTYSSAAAERAKKKKGGWLAWLKGKRDAR